MTGYNVSSCSSRSHFYPFYSQGQQVRAPTILARQCTESDLYGVQICLINSVQLTVGGKLPLSARDCRLQTLKTISYHLAGKVISITNPVEHTTTTWTHKNQRGIAQQSRSPAQVLFGELCSGPILCIVNTVRFVYYSRGNHHMPPA